MRPQGTVYSAGQILLLGETIMRHTGISPSALGLKAAGHVKLFPRLRAGNDILGRTAARATAYFNNFWPDGLGWPSSIPDGRVREP
jgi:hypothetical protein